MSGFDKQIPSAIAEYEVYTVNSGEELMKVASPNIDLPDDFIFDPDCLYLWVQIVSAGEYYGPNKNGDYFPGSELLEYYETFKTAHTFKNHENKNVEQAIGQVLAVRWNPIMKCVEVFKSIDKKVAPEIARGFLKGYLTDVSMGCKVPYTICSVCGNKARKKSEFCLHVNQYRMQFLGNGERVFEVNYEPNFHDSSAVLTGAERVAKAFMIIDTPPEGAKVSFQKVASSRPGVARFVRLSDHELNKVASYKENLHPMLSARSIEKVASHGFMQKIAELEKEVTGKLLNIVSDAGKDQSAAAAQIISIIKFLTDKRFTPEMISSIGTSLQGLAKSEGVSPQRVFSIFLGIAELLGIELYPSELHGILSSVTDAGLNDELHISEGTGQDLYPTEFAQGIKRTLDATAQLPEFNDAANLYDMYNEGAHQVDMIRSNPLGFVEAMANDGDSTDQPPVRVIKIIRQTLTPLMEARSTQPEFILPRLATVLAGFHPPIGAADARRDFDILANPQTLGDMLATFAYRNYQQMRPTIVRTRMIRLAMHQDSELEKVASFWDIARPPVEDFGPEGIKRRHLLMFGVPAIYGASLFQENRREHGRNLSDAENFVADHPGVISSGVVLGGKPLSRLIARGGVAASDKAKEISEEISARLKKVNPGDGVEKTSSANEFETLVKIADSFPTGNHSVFTEDMLAKFASRSGFSSEETVALKVATVLSISGMDKEAADVMEYYQIPDYAKGMFLKAAAADLRDEMPKIANDFVNNLLLDGFITPHAFTTTLPGRVLDAFVISKVMQKFGDKQPKHDLPDLPDPSMAGNYEGVK